MRRLAGLALFALLLFAATIAAAAAQSRVALVIGNGAYRSAPALTTTIADAALVAETMRAAGYDVTELQDLRQADIGATMRGFLDKVAAGGPDSVAFLYFAGYAAQYEGENYLVPVDATIAIDEDVAYEAFRLGDLLAELARLPSAARIVVLDAARDHGFGRGGPRPVPPGLAIVDVPDGMLVAFSAAPGAIAADGEGANSLYAVSLVTLMRQPGLDIEQIVKGARVQVNQSTAGAQVPWMIANLDVDLRLFEAIAAAPAPETAPSMIAPPTGAPVGLVRIPPKGERRLSRDFLRGLPPDDAYQVAIEEDTLQGYQWFVELYPQHPFAGQIWDIINGRREAVLWRRALAQNSRNAYWNYLKRYPEGAHANEAQERLEVLAAPRRPPPTYVPAAEPLPPDYYDEAVGIADVVPYGFAPPPPVFDDAPPFFIMPPPPRPPRPPIIIVRPPPPVIIVDRLHPPDIIRKPPDGIRRPDSGRIRVDGIRRPVDGIRQPVDGIRRPVDGIRQPVDGIRTPDSGRRPVDGIRRPDSGRRPPDGIRIPQSGRTTTPGVGVTPGAQQPIGVVAPTTGRSVSSPGTPAIGPQGIPDSGRRPTTPGVGLPPSGSQGRPGTGPGPGRPTTPGVGLPPSGSQGRPGTGPGPGRPTTPGVGLTPGSTGRPTIPGATPGTRPGLPPAPPVASPTTGRPPPPVISPTTGRPPPPAISPTTGRPPPPVISPTTGRPPPPAISPTTGRPPPPVTSPTTGRPPPPVTSPTTGRPPPPATSPTTGRPPPPTTAGRPPQPPPTVRPPPPTVRQPPPTVRPPPPTVRPPPPTVRQPPPTVRQPPPTVRQPPPTVRQPPPSRPVAQPPRPAPRPVAQPPRPAPRPVAQPPRPAPRPAAPSCPAGTRNVGGRCVR